MVEPEYLCWIFPYFLQVTAFDTMFLGSKFVYLSEGEEEEEVVVGNVSSEDEYFDSDDGEVCIAELYVTGGIDTLK